MVVLSKICNVTYNLLLILGVIAVIILFVYRIVLLII